MNNSHTFGAGYFFSQLWIQVKAPVILWYNHAPFLLPFIIVSCIALSLIYVTRKLLAIKRILNQEQLFLELTPPAFTDKSAYTTQQLFSVLHNIGSQRSIMDRLLGKKTLFSFEIVSTRTDGIRYILKTTPHEADIVKRTIVAYLPQVRMKEVQDYLPKNVTAQKTKIIEFKLRKHFAFPLAKQNVLEQHDPVAYITGMMTKLLPGELIAFQLVFSPTVTEETLILTHKILNNEDVLAHLNKSQGDWYLKLITLPFKYTFKALQEIVWGIIDILFANPQQQRYAQSQASYQADIRLNRLKPARVLSNFEQEVVASVQEKIDQSLFETSIRAFVMLNDRSDQQQRVRGMISSLATFSVPKYQALYTKYTFPSTLLKKIQLFTFKKRLVSLASNKSSMLLSASELAALYHFPFTETTKTENIVKVHSKKLPAPLSLKQERKLHVMFGENTYGETATPIGLTEEERQTHTYIIGRTGSGKTTLMFSMAKQDIEEGRGMAFIDPHGDVSEDLIASIPEDRKNDLIYINPVDLKYPIGINLLELTPGLSEDEAEMEKEVVCEGVISLFRKVFSKDENTNAHRIEYILRNTIHTALTIEDATIFTVYKLLNNPPFQQQVVSKLTDENLKDFWKFEFGRAGDFQVVKMVGGVTAKIGRFLFSPTAKRILEQKKSTINFDEILSGKKILICNFSQGNLGEDTARLLGTTVLTKIQQAALRRARVPKAKRTPFYLYVDEFQNFATNSFIKMLSEGRKYGLSVCIAEQSTSQQQDRDIVHNILANVTTVISFRSANPIDEQLMLTQFAPYVEKGDIVNLPRYTFYIKISALEPEEPFSGETVFIPVEKDTKKFERLIQASRDNYAIVYKRQTPSQPKITVDKETSIEEKDDTKEPEITITGGLPKKKKPEKTPTTRGGKK